MHFFWGGWGGGGDLRFHSDHSKSLLSLISIETFTIKYNPKWVQNIKELFEKKKYFYSLLDKNELFEFGTIRAIHPLTSDIQVLLEKDTNRAHEIHQTVSTFSITVKFRFLVFGNSEETIIM